MGPTRFQHLIEIAGEGKLCIHRADVPALSAGPCPVCMCGPVHGLDCGDCGTHFVVRETNADILRRPDEGTRRYRPDSKLKSLGPLR